jgi:putative peptide zinc metalloprotease protein
MYGYLWWIFTWTFFFASVGLMLAAILHVTVHFQTFYDKLPAYHEFFAYRTVLYLWLSLGVVKIIHEFGHGLSCKAFGGECHEMGVLLMCLSPALYANVTDAWTVADKWKRIVISFAGIYVELVIASIATFVWWYTPHLPVTNNVALCVMTLCSVSTVMFNANPLMRFDGYYMMADWLEIPNLRDRANRYITNLFQEICLGIETPPEAYMAPSRKVLFVAYAIASYVYRWVVTFSIIWFMSDFLGPQLKVISQMIAAMSLVSMFIWPAYRMIKNVRQRGRLPDMKPKRVYATLTGVALLLVGVFTVPLPISRVLDTGLVAPDPDHAEPVGLVDSGVLVAVPAKEGHTVRRGEVLARFDGRELREQLAAVASKRGEAQETAAFLGRQLDGERNLGSADREQIELQWKVATADAERYREEAEMLGERLRVLETLTAPRAGVVMGLPKPSETGKLFDRNYVQNKPVCTVADPGKLIVKMPVSAVDYRLLKDDLPAGGELPVSIYVNGRTDRLFRGAVRRLPESDARQVPFQLTQRGGGPLAVKQSGEGGQEVTPLAQTYLVEVEVLDPDATVIPGALVSTKIHCQWRSAAWWVGRKVSEALDIGLY